jgi:hypothetical protein
MAALNEQDVSQGEIEQRSSRGLRGTTLHIAHPAMCPPFRRATAGMPAVWWLRCDLEAASLDARPGALRIQLVAIEDAVTLGNVRSVR